MPRYLSQTHSVYQSFTRHVRPWYFLMMINSYLGLVSRKGLEMLVLETKHAETFLLKRTARRGGRDAFCCWAVLPERAVWEIQLDLCGGRYREALTKLNAEARFLGTVLPSADEEESFAAA